MRKLSQHQISSITTLLEGKNELEIANIMGCQRSTVARYRKKTSHDTSKPVQGRPRMLTCRDKRALAHLVTNSGTKTAVEATKIINLEREDKVSPGIVRLALRKQGLRAIKRVKKPMLSPDLNPIEHLWCLVKRRLGEYPETPKSMHELMKRVDDIWQNTHEDSCRTLIESMPSRVLAIKKTKEGHTKY
ncbi:hypothetical protein K3495_g15563 [Podosphaera aphanis]|nr:hypothetical protein K3495_g15563 [Podosphaera aphanis]